MERLSRCADGRLRTSMARQARSRKRRRSSSERSAMRFSMRSSNLETGSRNWTWRPNSRSAGHPFGKRCLVGFGYWNFGTDLALLCGKHKIPAVGYSPMQELYCHRPVDRIRTDFMDRAVIGNVAVFQHLAKLPKKEFRLP